MPDSSRSPANAVPKNAPETGTEENAAPQSAAPSSTLAKKKGEHSAFARLFISYYGSLFLLVVGIFLIVGFVVLRPLLETFKALGAEAAAAQEQLSDERAYLDSLNRSIAAAQQIPAETLADVEEALPSEPGIPELLAALSTIAETYNVQLSSVQFSAPREDAGRGQSATSRGTPVQFVEISMNLSSPNYAATRRYLDAIERNLRLFDVQTISVAPGQGETGQVYSIQLRTYLLPPSQRP